MTTNTTTTKDPVKTAAREDAATYRDEHPAALPDEAWATTAYEMGDLPDGSWDAYWSEFRAALVTPDALGRDAAREAIAQGLLTPGVGTIDGALASWDQDYLPTADDFEWAEDELGRSLTRDEVKELRAGYRAELLSTDPTE